MMTVQIWLFLLLLHLLISLLFWALYHLRLFRSQEYHFWLVLFVPAWGVLIALSAEWCARRGRCGAKPIPMDTLDMDPERFRPIGVDNDEDTVLPLEEAILINDAQTRRSLMIDILRQNPEQYVDLLQKARFNDDIEVTHYAATAMMELQREYDLKIQRYERACREKPDNIQSLDGYLGILKNYIDSGLITDHTLEMQRIRFRGVFEQRSKLADPTLAQCCDAADNLLALGEAHTAKRLIDDVHRSWPDAERPWLLLLKYFYCNGDGAAIRQTISEMKHGRLTATGRDVLAFWQEGADGRDAVN